MKYPNNNGTGEYYGNGQEVKLGVMKEASAKILRGEYQKIDA